MNKKKRSKILLILGVSGILSASIFVIEWIGASKSGSLALLADAGHIAADVFAHAISFVAILLASKKISSKYPFGYHRFEVLAALANGLLLVGISCFIFWESYERLLDQKALQTQIMLEYSLIGFVLNIASAAVLFGVSKENINVRSTYLHVLSDLLGTVAVVLGALLIQGTNLQWIDIALSFLLSLFILKTSLGIVWEAMQILLEKEPSDFPKDHLLHHLLEIPGVLEIKEILIRKLTSGVYSIELQAIVSEKTDRDRIVLDFHKVIKQEFSIPYVKIEILSKRHWEELQKVTIPDRDWESLAHHHHDHKDAHHHGSHHH